jgi:hypothetical protein
MILVVKNRITGSFFKSHIYMNQFKCWTKDPNKAKVFRSAGGIKNSLGKKVNVGKPGYPRWKCVLPVEYKIVELKIHSHLK